MMLQYELFLVKIPLERVVCFLLAFSLVYTYLF